MDQSVYQKWRSWPILLVGIFFPFIVFAKHIEVPVIVKEYLHVAPSKVDVFTYYRGIAVILMALSMLLIIGLDIIRNSETKKKWIVELKKPFNLAMLLLFLLIGLSLVMSEYKSVSLLGAYITGEGTLHWLSYIIIYFYTSFYITRDSFEKLGKWMFFASIFLFFVGLCAYLGYSLFEAEWYLKLIKPVEMKALEFVDLFAGQFSTFLGNPNHIGSYVALVLPMFMIFPFKWNKKNILYWTPIWTLFVILVFSRSSAGLLGTLVSILIWSVFLLKTGAFKVKRHGVMLTGLCVLYLSVSLIAGGGSISDEIAGLNTLNASKNITSKLSGISATPNTITFDYLSYEISIKRISNEIEFHLNDVAQDLRPVVIDDRSGYQILNDELGNITFYLVDASLMELHFDNHMFFMVNTPDSLVLTTMRLEPVYLEEIPSFGFKGYEKFASSRGYIWSRSLPLLKDTLMLGKGADTYALYFPQYDVVGKIIGFDRYNHAVDKPHNMYLMMAFSFGVTALALFVFSIMNMVYSTGSQNGFNIGFMTFAMLSGILTTWLFNDSMTLYAFVFWVLLGCISKMGVLIEQQ